MSRPSKRIYQTDLVLQSIVYLPMMISYLLFFVNSGFGILGALAQFGVGFVQVFSGAAHTLQYKDEIHKKYFIGAISYLVFLFFVIAWVNALGIFLYLFLFVIPVGIATWYYRLTWLLHKNADDYTNSINGKDIGSDDDLLDDMMVR